MAAAGQEGQGAWTEYVGSHWVQEGGQEKPSPWELNLREKGRHPGRGDLNEVQGQ